jgi:DNA-binding NarL/FixJ family response regulator
MTRVPVAVLTPNRLLAEGLQQMLEVLEFEVTWAGDPGDWPDEDPRAGAAEVLLIDARVEGWLDWSRRLSSKRPVVLFGMAAGEESALEALRAGARGVLTQDDGVDELSRATRRVHAGQVSAPDTVVARALDLLTALPAAEGRPTPLTLGLTPREQDIARRLAGGLSNREIAARSEISEATVKAHLTRIFRKLGVRDRIQLALAYRGQDPSTVPPRVSGRRAEPWPPTNVVSSASPRTTNVATGR